MNAPRDKTHARIAHDAYHTIDPRPVPALLKHVDLARGRVWEPAAGKLHLGNALAYHGHDVYCTDILEYPDAIKPGVRLAEVRNFFDFKEAPDATLKAIVTNPPNKLNVDFARHALKLMEPVRGIVAFYQRHEWDTSAKKTATLFDHPAYAMKITCRFRPYWFERQKGDDGPFQRFSWYVWDYRWPMPGTPIQRFA